MGCEFEYVGVVVGDLFFLVVGGVLDGGVGVEGFGEVGGVV